MNWKWLAVVWRYRETIYKRNRVKHMFTIKKMQWDKTIKIDFKKAVPFQRWKLNEKKSYQFSYLPLCRRKQHHNPNTRLGGGRRRVLVSGEPFLEYLCVFKAALLRQDTLEPVVRLYIRFCMPRVVNYCQAGWFINMST